MCNTIHLGKTMCFRLIFIIPLELVPGFQGQTNSNRLYKVEIADLILIQGSLNNKDIYKIDKFICRENELHLELA